MKTFRSLINLSLALVVSTVIAVPAYAASLEVLLDRVNVDLGFLEGTNYLKVTISDGSNGDIDFNVQTSSSLSDQAGSNYGIQSFSLNFGDSGANLDNLLLNDDWSTKRNPNHSIFGRFDVQLKGRGSSRQDPLQFSIVGVDGDTPDDYVTQLSSRNALFAAHVAGFDSSKDNLSFTRSNETSAQFGGASIVPIPAAAWLMFSALSVVAWRGRKAVATNGEADAA